MYKTVCCAVVAVDVGVGVGVSGYGFMWHHIFDQISHAVIENQMDIDVCYSWHVAIETNCPWLLWNYPKIDSATIATRIYDLTLIAV